MQRLEVSGKVRPIYGSLGVKRLSKHKISLTLTQTATKPSVCYVVYREDGTLTKRGPRWLVRCGV